MEVAISLRNPPGKSALPLLNGFKIRVSEDAYLNYGKKLFHYSNPKEKYPVNLIYHACKTLQFIFNISLIQLHSQLPFFTHTLPIIYPLNR